MHAERAWTHIRAGSAGAARDGFFDSVRAYTDVASVRGVGLSLIGLAATESIEGRAERAVQIAAAAEVYADQEGIVNVYSEQTPAAGSSTGHGHRFRRRNSPAPRRWAVD